MRKWPLPSVTSSPSASCCSQSTSKARTLTPPIGALVSQWRTWPQIVQAPNRPRMWHQ